MMSPVNTIALLLLICAAANAFTAPGAARAPSTVLQAGRRDFLDAAMSATAGLVVATIPGIARADEESVDDLSMPSEEEQKKAEEAAMAERLKRKAELQKQKSSSAMSFGASLAKEKEKQKAMQMTKEQRRDELCETLGRGC